MMIFEVTGNKKEYLSLLLLADEQEDMIDRYLEKGTMFVLEDGGVKAECVVTDEGDVSWNSKTWQWPRKIKEKAMEKLWLTS